jgi:hypothetical protein
VKGWHAVPESRVEYSYGNAAGAWTTRPVVDGANVAVFVPTSALFSTWAAWTAPVQDHYVGAARVLDAAGNVLVGRGGAPSQVSNGLIRVEFVAPPTSTGFIRISTWRGSAWGAWQSFELGTRYLRAATLRILRNTPQEVSVRIDQSAWGDPGKGGHLSLTLRRGERLARVQMNHPVADGTVVDPGSAGTNITGGRRATANNADGDRWVMAMPNSFTIPSGNVVAVSVASLSATFGLGIELGGSSASGANAAQELVYQYMAAQHETQRVVET